MKRTISPENKRIAIIRIRTTKTEANEIINGSDIASLSLSEYCRRRIFNRKITAHIDEKMISELRKIGGLLKKIFADGHGTDETRNVLTETKKAIQRIANPTPSEV